MCMWYKFCFNSIFRVGSWDVKIIVLQILQLFISGEQRVFVMVASTVVKWKLYAYMTLKRSAFVDITLLNCL